ncbi:hypothetical protein [Flavobacterium limi]|uniref:Lipoprotein n=1 Tax=Flavobacterium limi TaxID=2045105 RepID=A0ABQ1UUQ9_9FLAO|nr:hypothetical protein [Flavobacterium limi]GGF27460.1 hypothetical protein GCM10011518_41020 [Flavobacterium limi]
MNKSLFCTVVILILTGIVSCNKPKTDNQSTSVVDELPQVDETIENSPKTEVKKDFTDFLPEGHVMFDTIFGDLNKDNQEDCVLIIKGTDKNKIITHEYRGQLDRNRRGIIVLLNENGNYQLATKNYDCFSSENEDGGVYYAPELSVEVSKGKLFVNYGHGRYGYWSYTFRYQNNGFALIGYDASHNRGPVTETQVSINYLTRQKIVNHNTNENADDGEEIFEKTLTKIKKTKLTLLSEIKDFDELDISED